MADDTSTTTSAAPAATPAPADSTTTTTSTTETTTGSGVVAPAPDEPVVTDEQSYTTTRTQPNLQLTTTSSSNQPYVDSEVKETTWPNRKLLTTGATVLTLSYLPAVIAAATADDTSDNLYIPVAGPWIEMSKPNNGGNTALLAIDGVFQGLGALALLGGLVLPEKKTKDWYLIGSRDLHVQPNAGRASLGLTAAGRF